MCIKCGCRLCTKGVGEYCVFIFHIELIQNNFAYSTHRKKRLSKSMTIIKMDFFFPYQKINMLKPAKPPSHQNQQKEFGPGAAGLHLFVDMMLLLLLN